MKKLCAAMVPLLALTLAGGTALAKDRDPSQIQIPARSVEVTDLPNVSLGFTLGFQDLHATNPSPPGPTPTFSGISWGSALNFGASYRNRMGANSPWHVTAGGEFGFGAAKDEFSGPPAAKFEQKYSNWAIRAGIERVEVLSASTSIYGGGRLFYSSSKVKWDNGTNEYEGEPFKVIGFEPAIGCTHRLSPKLGMYGEFYTQFGWGSTEVGKTKYSETVKYGCWRGGLLFNVL